MYILTIICIYHYSTNYNFMHVHCVAWGITGMSGPLGPSSGRSIIPHTTHAFYIQQTQNLLVP